jgi:hypothetical protein
MWYGLGCDLMGLVVIWYTKNRLLTKPMLIYEKALYSYGIVGC